MVVNVKMSKRVERNPAKDGMSRSWVGWDPQARPEDIWANNRGVWNISKRALGERYATLSHDGVIRLVAEITGVEIIPAGEYDPRDKSTLVGDPLPAAHPVAAALIGQPVDRYRSPITYLDPLAAERGPVR